VIFIRHDVFFEFMKKFINCFGFLSWHMRSYWSWSQTLDQCLDCCFIIRFGNLWSLLHEPSHKVPQWLSVFLFAVVQIWWLSHCFMKYLECLNELCFEIDPAADLVWL
jgi:hypothetical protein